MCRRWLRAVGKLLVGVSLVAAGFSGLRLAWADDADLIAELKPNFQFNIPAPGANACLYYGTLNAPVGTPISQISADGILGCAGDDQSIHDGFIHFDASNSNSFALFVQHLTNTTEETMNFALVGFDSMGNILYVSPGGSVSESMLDSRTAGKSVTFVRYLQCGAVWQFWDGQPIFAGGGQNSEVDHFLTYQYPLEKTFTWVDCTSPPHINVTMTYGSTIIPSTFQATLNGQSFTGFTPVAGTTETVSVPLAGGSHAFVGRNTLAVSVDGLASGGQQSTDADRLTFHSP